MQDFISSCLFCTSIQRFDCNRTHSSFAQHEALKLDLEGARQEIDMLRSELEQSRAIAGRAIADLKQQQRDIIQQHEEDLQNLEEKTQLLRKGVQEQTALNVRVSYNSDA